MSKVITGIQGRPFRKVVKVTRETEKQSPFSPWVTELLSCGHDVTFAPWESYSKASKRRCYHPACFIKAKTAKPIHWLLRKCHPDTFCGIVRVNQYVAGGSVKVVTNTRIKATAKKTDVTCRSCKKLMLLHDHLEEEYVDLRSIPKD